MVPGRRGLRKVRKSPLPSHGPDLKKAAIACAVIVLSLYLTLFIHEAGHLAFALPYGCESIGIDLNPDLSGSAHCWKGTESFDGDDLLMLSGGIILTAAVGFTTSYFYERTKRMSGFLLKTFLFTISVTCIGSAFLNVGLPALFPGGSSDIARMIRITGIDSRFFVAIGFWMVSLLVWAVWEELPEVLRDIHSGMTEEGERNVFIALTGIAAVGVILYIVL